MTEPQKSGNDPSDPQNVTGGGKQPVGDAQITMTPAQLAERLGRAKAQARKDFADYDDYKAAAERLAELEKAQMSELERLKAEKVEAEAAQQRMQQKAQDTLIKATFVAEAAKLGVKFPEDAYGLATLAGVTIGEDDKVTGVAEAVKVLVDAGRLPLSGKPRVPSLDAGAGAGKRGGDSLKLSGEELIVAQKMGLTPEQYAKHKQTRVERELSAAEELEQLRAELRHLRQAQGS